ncbi:hypothetical protein CEXT_595801 [Caerostris extrusa]|uniref:Secreted protein n=1 Tax=Caerostris extrusa TaxID=172846 RepID=A0AAV4Y1N4_CAEEX|nr:hypothetical protein CEXT_595801 [Caerostris extrusa]
MKQLIHIVYAISIMKLIKTFTISSLSFTLAKEWEPNTSSGETRKLISTKSWDPRRIVLETGRDASPRVRDALTRTARPNLPAPLRPIKS